MSDRQRALPSWMARKEQKVSEKQPLKSRRKQKTAQAAFYCMNEKELVEAAVSCLSSRDGAVLAEQKAEDKAADTTVKKRENPTTSEMKSKPVTFEEESSDGSDAQEMTYVSESDLDITEVETVPYTKSLQHQGPEGQRSGGPVQDQSGVMNVGLEVEEKEERSQRPAEPAEEDDGFRLVREIFFN